MDLSNVEGVDDAGRLFYSVRWVPDFWESGIVGTDEVKPISEKTGGLWSRRRDPRWDGEDGGYGPAAAMMGTYHRARPMERRLQHPGSLAARLRDATTKRDHDAGFGGGRSGVDGQDDFFPEDFTSGPRGEVLKRELEARRNEGSWRGQQILKMAASETRAALKIQQQWRRKKQARMLPSDRIKLPPLTVNFDSFSIPHSFLNISRDFKWDLTMGLEDAAMQLHDDLRWRQRLDWAANVHLLGTGKSQASRMRYVHEVALFKQAAEAYAMALVTLLLDRGLDRAFEPVNVPVANFQRKSGTDMGRAPVTRGGGFRSGPGTTSPASGAGATYADPAASWSLHELLSHHSQTARLGLGEFRQAKPKVQLFEVIRNDKNYWPFVVPRFANDRVFLCDGIVLTLVLGDETCPRQNARKLYKYDVDGLGALADALYFLSSQRVSPAGLARRETYDDVTGQTIKHDAIPNPINAFDSSENVLRAFSDYFLPCALNVDYLGFRVFCEPLSGTLETNFGKPPKLLLGNAFCGARGPAGAILRRRKLLKKVMEGGTSSSSLKAAHVMMAQEQARIAQEEEQYDPEFLG